MKKIGFDRKPEINSGFRYLTSIFLIGLFILITSCQPVPNEPELSPEITSTNMSEMFEEDDIILATTEPTEAYQLPPKPSFYLGVDLSYVNEMDDCGAVYLQNGEPQDAYDLFQSHGAYLVRARLWHSPDWTEYSTFEDIKRTLARSKAAGMFTILDFHYSDNWADPGKQAIPAAWQGMNDAELEQAVYDYTYQVLSDLQEINLLPDFVQVGNETNSGMLKEVTKSDWPRDAKLFNAGIKAVRDISKETKTNPKIILHVAQPENAGWWFQNAFENNLVDFDIIGLSYYPQWSPFTINDLGSHITYLRYRFNKDVMIVETAYPWTLEAVDETASNILYQGIRGYPISTAGQRQFMIDLSQTLISNGGLGVVFWEPAWISTDCSTRWGQGSHWENVALFDFNNNNEVHAGIEFLSYDYLYPAALVDGIIEEPYKDAIVEDAIGDNFNAVPHLDLVSLHAMQDETFLSLALTISGDIFENPWGSYLFYIDTTQNDQGADIDVGKRPITVADPYKPEFRLDILALDRKGTVSGTFVLNVWDGQAWQTSPITFGIALKNGTPSIIEIQIPKSLLGYPQFVNLSVLSTGRGRVHTAGDILGINFSPSDWAEPLTLENFIRIDLTE